MAQWSSMVARGQRLMQDWSARPGSGADGHLDPDGDAVLAPPENGTSVPGAGSSAGGPGRFISLAEVCDVALGRGGGQPVDMAADPDIALGSSRPCAVEDAAASDTGPVQAPSPIPAPGTPLVDSPLRGRSRRPGPLDTSRVPDLTGPADESMWYDASARGCGGLGADHGNASRGLDYLDLFAGGGAVCAVFAASGYRCASFDAAVDPRCDILTEGGFRIAMDMTTRLRPGGLILAGPPCSLWTFMSSSVHKRNDACPEGDTGNRKVRMSNLLVSNLVTVLQHATARGVYWIVEQPMTSRMWSWPPMAALLSACNAVRARTHMGAFGHRQAKPTVLMGTLPTLGLLEKPLGAVPLEVRRRAGEPSVVGYKRAADGRVSGNRFLHQSAAYTEQFGDAVLQAWVAASAASTADRGSGSGKRSGTGGGPGPQWKQPRRTSMCEDDA